MVDKYTTRSDMVKAVYDTNADGIIDEAAGGTGLRRLNLVQGIVIGASLAEINAGKTLLPGVTGQTITIHDFTALVDGAFAATTSVDLEDTNGTPVAIATMAVAALTDGAVIKPGTANVTLGAGYLGALTTGAGIAVTNTGDDATTATGITFYILYSIATA